MIYAQSLRNLINRHDCWVALALFKTTDVLLAEAGNFGKLFLSQAFPLPEMLDVSSDHLAHIHALKVSVLHTLSLSTIVCYTLTADTVRY